MILFFYLLIALLWDLYEYRIPNGWIVTGIFLGIIHLVVQREITVYSLLEGLLYCSILLVLFYLKVLGGGDVKVFYVSTLFLGSSVRRLILLSFLLNGIYAGIQILMQRDMMYRLYHFYRYVMQSFYDGKIRPYHSINGSKKDQIHFMVGVFLGYIFINQWRVHL